MSIYMKLMLSMVTLFGSVHLHLYLIVKKKLYAILPAMTMWYPYSGKLNEKMIAL